MRNQKHAVETVSVIAKRLYRLVVTIVDYCHEFFPALSQVFVKMKQNTMGEPCLQTVHVAGVMAYSNAFSIAKNVLYVEEINVASIFNPVLQVFHTVFEICAHNSQILAD